MQKKGSRVDFPFFCIGALCRSFAVAALFFVRLFLLRKFTLRNYLRYGESKRAGNGWRVCRTDNFAKSKIVVRRLLRAPMQKGSRVDFPFFCIGAPNRTRTYDTAVNSRMLYRLSYRGICDSEYYIIICYGICQAFFYQIEQIFHGKFSVIPLPPFLRQEKARLAARRALLDF